MITDEHKTLMLRIIGSQKNGSDMFDLRTFRDLIIRQMWKIEHDFELLPNCRFEARLIPLTEEEEEVLKRAPADFVTPS